jgi:hypothetical protein
MSFVIKTELIDLNIGQTVRIEERAMYNGNNVTEGDQVFIWFSETQGGVGLSAVGHVTRVEAINDRITVEIQIDNDHACPFGNEQIACYRDMEEGSALPGLAKKLYLHSHNKIAALNELEAALLEQYFR